MEITISFLWGRSCNYLPRSTVPFNWDGTMSVYDGEVVYLDHLHYKFAQWTQALEIPERIFDRDWALPSRRSGTYLTWKSDTEPGSAGTLEGLRLCLSGKENTHIRVYDHYCEKLTVNDSLRLQKRLVEEIKKRDMLYHAVGHTWQSVPFGLDGTFGGDTTVPEESRKYLALVNGKRDIMFNNPLETEVCYSNPEVRRIIINAVIKYCKEHPEVDYLHFWQSDGANNCCECELCRDKRAADIYVPLLNELDRELTREGITTKIVFLCYANLTWAPVSARFENTDRFVFMGTIAHTYSKPLTCYEREPVIPPYVLNKNIIPKNNESSTAMLKEWQKVFNGDSFLFDYNQIWDHYKDPGYMKCAERIAGDAPLLKELNLNGLHSCQVTQAGLPTWLPTYTHGLTVWNDKLSFKDITEEYFRATLILPITYTHERYFRLFSF